MLALEVRNELRIEGNHAPISSQPVQNAPPPPFSRTKQERVGWGYKEGIGAGRLHAQWLAEMQIAFFQQQATLCNN